MESSVDLQPACTVKAEIFGGVLFSVTSWGGGGEFGTDNFYRK